MPQAVNREWNVGQDESKSAAVPRRLLYGVDFGVFPPFKAASAFLYILFEQLLHTRELLPDGVYGNARVAAAAPLSR